jgi:hypothetical protein
MYKREKTSEKRDI